MQKRYTINRFFSSKKNAKKYWWAGWVVLWRQIGFKTLLENMSTTGLEIQLLNKFQPQSDFLYLCFFFSRSRSAGGLVCKIHRHKSALSKELDSGCKALIRTFYKHTLKSIRSDLITTKIIGKGTTDPRHWVIWLIQHL